MIKKYKIIAVCACGLNGEIGFNNSLLCYLPSDLAHFKKLTQGNIVIMGRNTFDSLGKLLPNRHHWIMSRKNYPAGNFDFTQDSNEPVFYFSSKEDLIKSLEKSEQSVAFVIGGQQIYELFENDYDEIYLTHIHSEFEADAFFPLRILDKYKSSIIKKSIREPNNQHDFHISHYIKK